MTCLSVNINKVALLRNSRGRDFPSVLWFAERCLELGAHGITLHPRPDQRHARYSDVAQLKPLVDGHYARELNVEGYPSREFLDVVCQVKPTQCTLVPDASDQLTSDHGWDLQTQGQDLAPVIDRLRQAGVRVSLFLSPDTEEVHLARQLGADRIEIYTEPYAAAYGSSEQSAALEVARRLAKAAQQAGLGVNAGHDLSLTNLETFLQIPGILEVSIGHALTVECLEQGVAATVAGYLALCR